MFNEHKFVLASSSSVTKLIDPIGTCIQPSLTLPINVLLAQHAITQDPITKVQEYWLGCFSQSRLDGIKQRTTPIRLIVALDISGSMGDTLTVPKVI